MAEIVKLELKAGTTFERVLTLTDATRTTPLNIENYTFVGRIRENHTTDTIAATFSIQKLMPYTLGTVVISLDAETTATLTQRKYVFDIAFTRNSLRPSTDVLMEGYVVVRQTTLY